MPDNNLVIRDANWVTDNTAIRQIRTEVFIKEQQVPEALEWDKQDSTALHCLALLNDKPVATGRLQTDGQIGRMAVLKPNRKTGIGSKVLLFLIKAASADKNEPVFLHAQKQAVEFYKKFNFIQDDNEFMEAGIPHYLMTLK